LLAEAVDMSRSEGTQITEALDQTATAAGHRIGGAIRAGLVNWIDQEASAKREALIEALAAKGFEPSPGADGTVVLRNCPFHHLAQDHTELVCGMNLCLFRAIVDHLEGVGLEARLEPTADTCCVRLHLVSQDESG
jgi:predicted ArsR family transcriptional regulator